ncbi:MAG: LysM peptidoglycan-binding domain-containing protein [Candidatus Azobacteroides sp.]|nr:LysM peptidoglycan-binding domain-containing protein [Candidatus Azobacteroides sp.]
MFKRYLILISFLGLYLYNVNSQNTFYSNTNNFPSESENYFMHTVERGQTVYSISKMYGVSIESIYKLNLGSEQGIQSESQLKIPQSKQDKIIFHTIEPKETLYSVSKKYNIKGEDLIEANPGLSIQTFIIGRTIRIPLDSVKSSLDSVKEDYTNSLLFQTPEVNKVNFINVAMLLPFGVKEKTNPANLQFKVVEYYEGFLLALDSLKKQGISVHLQVMDIGNDTKFLKQILQADDLKQSNLIIGGFSDEQIILLSDFSNQHRIPYIVPFASKCDEILKNPYLFQIYTPAGYLYTKASKAFLNKYRNYNIIFLQEDNADKADFIQILKNDLTSENITYQTIAYSPKFASDLQAVLNIGKRNVLIPYSEKQESLTRILPGLVSISQKPEYNLSLFGYPKWQTYDLGELTENLYNLNTTIYTNFYIKQNAPETRNFYRKFFRWYSRPVNNSYPKFSVWGFDTGMYFIQLINQFGTFFESNVNNLKYEGIQTNFYYQRVSNWGGFVNANVFFVNFNPDSSVTRETR